MAIELRSRSSVLGFGFWITTGDLRRTFTLRTAGRRLRFTAMQRVRLLTYNIAHGRGLAPIQGLASSRKIRSNLRKIAQLLQRHGPDVVALQEVDECSRWAGNFDHLDYLKVHAGYPYSVFGITNSTSGLLKLSYGNAILSRHPIMDSETIVFGSSKVGEKGFLFVELDVAGRRVPFVTMHLHYRSRDHRFVQTDRFLAWLHDKQRRHRQAWAVPPILCGDLNNPGHLSDATATLLSHLFDYCDYTLHPRDGKTFPSPLPTRLLDFVFLPEGCHDAQSTIIRSFLSDHRPVLVEFGI